MKTIFVLLIQIFYVAIKKQKQDRKSKGREAKETLHQSLGLAGKGPRFEVIYKKEQLACCNFFLCHYSILFIKEQI